MSTYDNAIVEAKALLGDPKSLKGASTVVVMRSPMSKEYFAVRGTRAEGLKAEGFVLIAEMDHAGNITKIS